MNVDGVLFGVRRLARVMGDGDAIVVRIRRRRPGLAWRATRSTRWTKHAVIGLVRSVAPGPGVRDPNQRRSSGSPTPPWLRASLARLSSRRAFRSCGQRRSPTPCSSHAAREPASGSCSRAGNSEPYRFRGIPGPSGPRRGGHAPAVSSSQVTTCYLGRFGAELARSRVGPLSGIVERCHDSPRACRPRLLETLVKAKQSVSSDRRDLPASRARGGANRPGQAEL